MGPVTRTVQTGIGLVAELKAAREARNAPQGSGDDDVSTDVKDLEIDDKDGEEDEDDNSSESEDDEHFGGSEKVEGKEGVVTSPVDDGDDDHPAYTEAELSSIGDVKYPKPSTSSSSGEARPKLRCPVVIPQRRPGTKGRGFLRAYAPVLADHQIDEQTFLAFLKDFHKASQASPIFDIITLGAGAMGHIAEPITIALAITIQFASGTAAELQSRYRKNTFLDRANTLLFKPRGLYCLIMSLRPNSASTPRNDIGLSSIDNSSPALKWLDPKHATFRAKLRNSSGTTHGEGELPETAPLCYPDTGYVERGRTGGDGMSKTTSAASGGVGASNGGGGGGGIVGEFTSYQKVVGNYFDKRAQAKYTYKHPDSTLAAQEKPQFASKYGDPTHPSVTMNYWGRVVSKIEKESLVERQARRHAKALEVRRRNGGVRRFLEGSVLYLMIVNLPTEAEVAAAKEAVEEIPAGQGGEEGEVKREKSLG